MYEVETVRMNLPADSQLNVGRRTCAIAQEWVMRTVAGGLIMMATLGQHACANKTEDGSSLLLLAAASLSQSAGNSNPKTFVIPNIIGGNMGGIAGADAICAGASNRPADGKTYRAFLVDGTNRVACTTANCSGGSAEHVDWVLAPSKTYTRVDGSTVLFETNENGIFVFGTAQNSWSASGDALWGGFADATWVAGDDCNNWGGTAGGGRAMSVSATDGNMISFTLISCSIALRPIVCVQQQ